MLLILVLVLVFILGCVGFHIYNNSWSWDYDFLGIFALLLVILSSLGLFICLLSLALKPVELKKFKINYELITATETEKDDLRDVMFTQKILEVNESILSCREYKDSLWLGIFENKEICDYELINK